MSAVTIHPTFNAFYYSFYIQGLIEAFGRSSLSFSTKSFPRVPANYLVFVVRDQRELRVVLDAYDDSRLTHRTGIEWCDVYGKVNLTWRQISQEHAYKCRPVGPSFAVRVSGSIGSCWVAARNYRRFTDYSIMGRGTNNTREHFANYFRQYKYRLPIVRSGILWASDRLQTRVGAEGLDFRDGTTSSCATILRGLLTVCLELLRDSASRRDWVQRLTRSSSSTIIVTASCGSSAVSSRPVSSRRDLFRH